MAMKNMSEGKPFKVILLFAIPMILSVSLQQLYNLADSVIAGKLIGNGALAAVSVSTPICVLYLAIGNGAGIGRGVAISQIFGAGDLKRTREAVLTSLASITALSLAVMLLGVLTAEPSMRLLQTPTDIIGEAEKYLRIYVYGIPFLFLYNGCASIFQSLGNSKTPLFLLLFSTCFNVLLDVIFVRNLGMGVAGLAWGTFVAQGTACVLSLGILLFSLRKLGAGSGARFFDGKIYKRMIYLSFPIILQQAVVSIGQLCIQGRVNGYGATVISAYATALKLNSFGIMIFITVSNAMSTYIAQNVGAQNLPRIKEGIKDGFWLSLAVAAITSAITLIFAKQLIGIFLNADGADEILAVATKFIYIVTPFNFVVCVKIVFDSVLKGTGKMLGFTLDTTVDLLSRVGFAYLLSYLLSSETGIWWGWPIGWSIATVIAFLFYLFGGWQKVVKPKDEQPVVSE